MMEGAPGEADTTLTVDEAAPVPPGQRILTIDILRGFAILGILLVNMELFNQAVLNVAAGLNPPATAVDQVARWLVAFWAEGKFYTTFSFLFGLGMVLQMDRAETRGVRFGRFWVRRMLVLAVFGLVHAYLIWPGDILILYAVLGLVLLLWRKARPRTLAIGVLVTLLAPIVLNAALLALMAVGRAAVGEAAMTLKFQSQMAAFADLARVADRAYAQGSFWEVTLQRARDMNFIYMTWPFFGLNVLAAMLMGLWAGKRGIFADIPGHLPFIRRAWRWGLVLGLVGNALFVHYGDQGSRMVPSGAMLVATTGQTFGAPALAVFYMASLTLLAERAAWRRRLAPLAYVGRMALTNYLLQSLICTSLFYGYGLGLYGRVGIAGGLVLALAIYAAQVAFSAWWLARCRFGPMEWLWRTLTYGQRPVGLASE